MSTRRSDTGSRPLRRLAPFIPRSTSLPRTSGSHAQQSTSSVPKRRTVVTAACQLCRKHKTKCDAGSPCAACKRRNAECLYETEPSETRQQALKRKVAELQNHSSSYRVIYNLLRDQPKNNADRILERIRSRSDVESILEDPTLLRQSIRSEAGLPMDNISEQKTALAALPPIYSEREFELLVRHPNAYPTLNPLDDIALSKGSRFRPVKISQPNRDNPRLNPSQTLRSIVAAPSLPQESDLGSADAASLRSSPNSSYFDKRLERLNIAFWTAVPITNQYAARAISLYLETDHPFLGLFDADLFLEDLVDCQLNHCSAFLVSSLLAFASQAYTLREPVALSKSYEFESEAKRLAEVELHSDSLTTVAGLLLLYESIGTHGKMALSYINHMFDMAARMRLFGVEERLNTSEFATLSSTEQRSTASVAWGAFNFFSMVSLFDVVVASPYPPSIPKPGSRGNRNNRENMADTSASTPDSKVQVFPSLCSLWTVASEVVFFYRTSTGQNQVPLAFALSKYYKLLCLADNLTDSMVRRQNSTAQTLVFHIWYHAVVLYIFRPFIVNESHHDIGKWTSPLPSPEAIFAASVKQMKRLILIYGAEHPCAAYSVFWHAGLMYVANAALKSPSDDNWKSYFVLCIRGYSKLAASFRFASGLAQGLLGMALDVGAISHDEALILNCELRYEATRYGYFKDTVQGFTLDLNLAQSNQKAARVEELIDKFEEITLFNELTTGIY